MKENICESLSPCVSLFSEFSDSENPLNLETELLDKHGSNIYL